MTELTIITYLSCRFVVGKFEKVCQYLAKPTLSNQQSHLILTCSLHDIALIQQNKELRKIYRSVNYFTTDGMPLVWIFSRLLKNKIDRVYAPDLMAYIFNITQGSEYRHVFFGSTINTLHKMEENMKQKYPKLNIVGKIAPPFSPLSIKEEMDYFDRISALKPTFIWLGLGSPKQVIFGARLKKKITGCKIFCVGAGFDFIAKNKQQAPRLLQKIGLEWMFRLFTEPKRLWKRYLVTIGFYYMTHYRALITLLGNKCMKNQ